MSPPVFFVRCARIRAVLFGASVRQWSRGAVRCRSRLRYFLFAKPVCVFEFGSFVAYYLLLFFWLLLCCGGVAFAFDVAWF